MKRIIALVLSVIFVCGSFTGCGMLDTFGELKDKMVGSITGDFNLDYDEIIENFVSTPLNSFSMEVGDVHKPNAAVWLEGSRGSVYTSDEGVVIVSSLGKVTAVGEGTAYVIIVSAQGLYEEYCYTVK